MVSLPAAADCGLFACFFAAGWAGAGSLFHCVDTVEWRRCVTDGSLQGGDGGTHGWESEVIHSMDLLQGQNSNIR